MAHFDVIAMIGEGGMAAVYRATDTKLGREVAIKVLPEAVTGDPRPSCHRRRLADLVRDRE